VPRIAGLLGIAGMIIITVALGIPGYVGARTGGLSVRQAKCPISLLPTLTAPEQALAAARREIPVAFKGRFRNQDGRVRLAKSAYVVSAIIALNEGAVPRLAARMAYRRLAVRRCGSGVADRSWAVIFQVPQAGSVAYGSGVAFVTRTVRGWTLWYGWIGVIV
jgi:hypothetical protein